MQKIISYREKIDSEHPFLIALQELMDTGREKHLEAAKRSKNHFLNLARAPNKSDLDITVVRMRKIKDVLQRISVPTIEEIESIALTHGLEPESVGSKEFLKKGQDYINHVQTHIFKSAKLPEQKEENKEPIIVEVGNTLRDKLQALRTSRYTNGFDEIGEAPAKRGIISKKGISGEFLEKAARKQDKIIYMRDLQALESFNPPAHSGRTSTLRVILDDILVVLKANPEQIADIKSAFEDWVAQSRGRGVNIIANIDDDKRGR